MTAHCFVLTRHKGPLWPTAAEGAPQDAAFPPPSLYWWLCWLKPPNYPGRWSATSTHHQGDGCRDDGCREEEGLQECLLTDGRGLTRALSVWTVLSHLFFLLRNCEVYFKCIYRRCCQSVCLSTAPAVLIYRQLYLVVMLFLGSKRRVCLAEREIGGTVWLALGRSPCSFFASSFLLGQMQFLLAASIPTWAPLVVPLSLCYQTSHYSCPHTPQSPRSPDTESTASRVRVSTSHTHTSKIYTCTYADIQTYAHHFHT